MTGGQGIDIPEEGARVSVEYDASQSGRLQSVSGIITDVDEGTITLRKDRERYRDGPDRRLQLDARSREISSITSKRTTKLGQVSRFIFRGPTGEDSNECMNASIHTRMQAKFQRSGILSGMIRPPIFLSRGRVSSRSDSVSSELHSGPIFLLSQCFRPVEKGRVSVPWAKTPRDRADPPVALDSNELGPIL